MRTTLGTLLNFMAVIRIKHSDFETKYRVPECSDTLNTQEWAAEDANRVKDAGWESRYDYEAQLIAGIPSEKVPSILELGPGPGVLCEKIQNMLATKGFEAKYDLIDKPFAKEAFEKANRKGRFFVKDLSAGFDTTGLREWYSLIIANDFLEHVFNPSAIVQEVYKLLSPNGVFFVSVPNWRMGHQFVYRGLWDYDNFLYFMTVHGFEAQNVSPSILTTPDYPRLSSEEEMPEELRLSWNWYFAFGKVK
jgi:2-polyprenyl-3-methyl-5-hydroxy-6-metoxy-1,4-benzoquinol methylase